VSRKLRIIYYSTDNCVHLNDDIFSRIDVGYITPNENKGENNIYKSVNSDGNEVTRRAIYKNAETIIVV